MELTLKGLPFGRAAKSNEIIGKRTAISEKYAARAEEYRILSEDAENIQAVLFGGDTAADIPLEEMCEAAGMYNVLNRSFQGLMAADAAELIKESVLGLFPENIVLCIGEQDIESGASAEDTAETFERLMAFLKKEARGTRISVMSVWSEEHSLECRKYNELIREISRRYGFEFADVSGAFESAEPQKKIFSLIGRFLRKGIDFSQAMLIGAV